MDVLYGSCLVWCVSDFGYMWVVVYDCEEIEEVDMVINVDDFFRSR